MRVVSLLITVLTVSAVAQAAEVYRSVEPDGTVRYSDRPVGENSEAITIVTPRPATPPPAPPPAAQTAPQGPAAEPAAESEPPPPTPQQLAAERAANCTAAQERNARYQMSRRLFRTTPDGEREYLSDEELDAAKAGAVADVAKWCN